MIAKTLARFGALALLGASSTPHPTGAPPRVTANDNRTPAGTLRNGVLTLRLEVRAAEWHPDKDSDPGLVMRAADQGPRRDRDPGHASQRAARQHRLPAQLLTLPTAGCG